MNVLDLFSGVGAFSLGLERAGMRTVAFCEIAPYPRAILRKHWPQVPCYDDIRTLSAGRLRADGISVDVICGGFPCQDLSYAGLGAGFAGQRSGLWFEYLRLIGELRPGYVIVENVKALLSRGIDVVLGGLASIGYDAEWDCIPASYVGAPHDRDRIWIVAYPERGERRQEPYSWSLGRVGRKQQSVPWDRPWQDSLRELRRVDDGSAYRVHRVDTIRNSIVPQIPEAIGRAIMTGRKQSPEALYQQLLHKYSHVGCPAARYEDNCDRPSACAENGRCLDLPASLLLSSHQGNCK